MKTGAKLVIGVICAGIAIAAVIPSKPTKGECYTENEVKLLMKANGWSRKQAVDLLNMACGFSGHETEHQSK